MKLLKRLKEKLTKRMKWRILLGLSLIVIAIVAIVIIVEMNNYGKEQLRIASILAVEDDEASKYDPYDRSQKRSAYGDLDYELGYELEQFTGGIAGACGFDWNAVIASYTDADPEKAMLQVMQLADAYSLVNHEPFSLATIALLNMECNFFAGKHAIYGITQTDKGSGNPNMSKGKYDIYKYLGGYLVPDKSNTTVGSGAILDGASGAFTPVQIEADKDSAGHIYIDATNPHLQDIYGDNDKLTLRRSAQKALELVGHPDIYSDAVAAFADNSETVQISSAKELIDKRGLQLLSVDLLAMLTSADAKVNLIGKIAKDEDAPDKLTDDFLSTGSGKQDIAGWDNLSPETRNLMQVMAAIMYWNGGNYNALVNNKDLQKFALDYCNYLVINGSDAIMSSKAFNNNEYSFHSNAIYGSSTQNQKEVKACWDAILDCVYGTDAKAKQDARDALDGYGTLKSGVKLRLYSGMADGSIHTISYKYAFDGLLRAQVSLKRICDAANCGTVPNIYTVKYEQTFAARTSAGGRGASGSFVEDMLRYCENRLGVEYTKGLDNYLGVRWYSPATTKSSKQVGYDCASLVSASIIEGAGIQLGKGTGAMTTESLFSLVKNDKAIEVLYANPTFTNGKISNGKADVDAKASLLRPGDIILWSSSGASRGHAALVYSVESEGIKVIETAHENYNRGGKSHTEKCGVRILSLWEGSGMSIAYIFRITQHTADLWGSTKDGPHPEVTAEQESAYMYIGKKAWQDNQDKGLYLNFFTAMPSYITKD